MDKWKLAYYERNDVIYGWTIEPVIADERVGYYVVVYDGKIGPQPGVTWRRWFSCLADAKVHAIHLFELRLDPTVDFLSDYEVTAE